MFSSHPMPGRPGQGKLSKKFLSAFFGPLANLTGMFKKYSRPGHGGAGITQWDRQLRSAQDQRSFNMAEAQKQRDWQERMSNTAYTRSMADIKQAGLHPSLALGAPASTPSGAAASASQEQAGTPTFAGSTINFIGRSLSALGIKQMLT